MLISVSQPHWRTLTFFRDCAAYLRRGGAGWWVVGASLLLSIVGILAIDVASPARAGVLAPAAAKQLLYTAVGVFACVIMCVPHYRRWGHVSWILYAGSLLLLLFLLLPFLPASVVRARGGARAWIDLGPVDLQPSELMKPALVLVLAWYLRYRKNHRKLPGLLPPAIITGLPMGMIMLQPDLGSAILFIPALFFVLFAAGARTKHLVLVIAVAMLAAPAAYPLLKPHQKQRIAGLIMQAKGDDRADLDINMQSVTAQRMIGAGRLTGMSEEAARTLHRFNALPERHNDMVFAVICTRWGLLGALGVLTLFVAWSGAAFTVAAACAEPFGRLIVVGCVGFLAAQVVINIGMNLGLLPIIGITLPFVSNGGSSMLAQWMMTGLVLGVALHKPAHEFGRNLEWSDDDA